MSTLFKNDKNNLANDVTTTCTEFLARIVKDKSKVRISFAGTTAGLYSPSLYQAIQLKVFDHYRATRAKDPSTKQVASFYFTVEQQDDNDLDVQGILTEESCRILVYSAPQGLPALFKQRETRLAQIERARIRRLLETGITRNKVFSLVYQPIVEIGRSGEVMAIKGAEAFLRIRDGDELNPPKKYLDIAEEDPILMRKVGYKILELACSDLKVFKAKYPMFTVSLNVSEQQFAKFDDGISFERIFAMIKEHYEIDRHDIALEIPEVTADVNAESAAMLKRLFDNGTPIILDNFTIGALMKNPVVDIDIYKVSGQTLRNCIAGSEREKYVARDFLRRVFLAAHQFGKSVVVKGVESLDQVAVLVELGFAADIDLVQGNAYCPPLDLGAFEMIYKENVTRLYRRHLMDLFKRASVRVLHQKSQMLINVCSYLRKKRLTADIDVAQSFSELWSAKDRNLVMVMGFDFVSYVVSPDQLKNAARAEETWQELLDDGSLFEIPGLPMALINNFQDKDRIAELFGMVEEYDGHNLYQILITINKEKTEKIPFIILSETDTHMQHLEENVLILNNLDNLEKFEETFISSIADNPQAIRKFSRF